MSRLYNPTYEDIHDACWGFAKQLRLYEIKLDTIIGLSRGGLMPASTLSQMLNVPLLPVSYSSKKGKGDDRNHTNQLPVIEGKKKILILDDICDSGHTLKEVADAYLNGSNVAVYTAAIYYKRIMNPPIIPNLIWVIIPEDAPFVTFPWEKQVLETTGV